MDNDITLAVRFVKVQALWKCSSDPNDFLDELCGACSEQIIFYSMRSIVYSVRVALIARHTPREESAAPFFISHDFLSSLVAQLEALGWHHVDFVDPVLYIILRSPFHSLIRASRT